MAGRKKALALLIATDEYVDATFQQLRSPPADVEALAAVLADPAIGGYEVRTLRNPQEHDARLAIEDLFADVARDDLILLYISGHGVKDDEGLLHFAMTNSRYNRLSSTAIDSQFVRNRMHFSRSRKIVVCLDCCYAGAFPSGFAHRSAGSAGVLSKLAGKGRAVMTSSSAIEYSYETSDKTSVKVSGTAIPSVFTGSLVRGLRTGLADRNWDGLIDVDELYEYVHDQIESTGATQTPGLNSNVEGRLFVAISPAGPAPDTGPATRKSSSVKDRPEDAIPVARLAAEIGQPWKRSRWGSTPRQPVIHLIRPTTPELLTDQLAEHLGDTVPHVLVSSPEPVLEETALLNDLLKLLDNLASAFNDHTLGRARRFRFQRFELVTWLLKQEKSSLLGPRHAYAPDLEGAGTLVAQRWLLRQSYLTSGRVVGIAAFAQRLLASKNADVVPKLLIHAFLADLAEGYGRQWLWVRWADHDYYPTLLLQRLTMGTISAAFIRLVNDVRTETGALDPLLIIVSGPAVLQDAHQSSDVVLPEQKGLAGRFLLQKYVPVLVADQPKLASAGKPALEGGAKAWPRRVLRPRVRSFLVRNRYISRFLQVFEASFYVSVVVALLILAGVALASMKPPEEDWSISILKDEIAANNVEARKDPAHVTLIIDYIDASELEKAEEAQSKSLETTVPIVLEYSETPSPGNQ